MSAREIAEELGGSRNKIYPLLNKLLRWKEVYSKEIPAELSMKLFNSDRRMYIFSYKIEYLDKF